MSNLIFFPPSAGLDIGPISDDPSSLPQPNVNQSSRPLSEEQLDGILSPELDKMVTDGNFLSFLIWSYGKLGGFFLFVYLFLNSNCYLHKVTLTVCIWLQNYFYCIFW